MVTGDFNVGETNPAIKRLTASLPSAPALFVDTFCARYPTEARVGTFSGFKFEQIGADKIDYVLVQPGTDVLDAAIIRTSRNNRYPLREVIRRGRPSDRGRVSVSAPLSQLVQAKSHIWPFCLDQFWQGPNRGVPPFPSRRRDRCLEPCSSRRTICPWSGTSGSRG
jgi:hypothetical protein